MNNFTVDGFTIKRLQNNTEYFAHFEVFQDNIQVAYVKFDDGYFSVSCPNYNGLEIYESEIKYFMLAAELQKAIEEIKKYVIKKSFDNFVFMWGN